MATLLGKWLDWVSFIMTGFGWSMCTRNVASISRLLQQWYAQMEKKLQDGYNSIRANSFTGDGLKSLGEAGLITVKKRAFNSFSRAFAAHRASNIRQH
jgi:hypothetical protein